MTSERARALIQQVDQITRWTLRGGNDPEDHGDVKRAVEQLAEVMKEMLQEQVSLGGWGPDGRLT